MKRGEEAAGCVTDFEDWMIYRGSVERRMGIG